MMIFKEFEPRNICSVAVAIIGAAGVGAAATAYAANKASSTQREASDKAAGIAQQQYQQTRTDLSPFRQTGIDATTQMNERLPFLTSPITLSKEWLEGTPGYQFTRDQGLKSVQNSAAARGLGVSGAAQKGAASWATNLANQTYKTQFDVENTNRTNTFTRLVALINQGQAAAAGTAASGNIASQIGANAAIQGGNAAAAGINATGGAVNRFASDAGAYAMWRGMYDRANGNNLTEPYGYGNDAGQYNPNVSGGVVGT